MPELSRRALLGLTVAGGLSACSATTTTSTTTSGSRTSVPASSPTTKGAASAGTGSATTLASPLLLDGPDIVHGSTTRPMLALTFHGDGDPAIVRSVLASAGSAGAHITVFAIGRWLEAHVSLGRDIVAAGHALGNHTWSHQNLPGMSRAQSQTEIQKGADAVAKVLGEPGPLFRPSQTRFSTPTIRAAARAVGYHRCVSYDVDPLDYRDPGADAVRVRTLAGARAGAIVSLHLGHQGTAQALPAILAGLAAKGLSAVTVPTLLKEST